MQLPGDSRLLQTRGGKSPVKLPEAPNTPVAERTLTAPGGPTGPGGPAGPAGPIGPLGPVVPGGPAGPVGPAGPSQAISPKRATAVSAKCRILRPLSRRMNRLIYDPRSYRYNQVGHRSVCAHQTTRPMIRAASPSGWGSYSSLSLTAHHRWSRLLWRLMIGSCPVRSADPVTGSPTTDVVPVHATPFLPHFTYRTHVVTWCIRRKSKSEAPSQTTDIYENTWMYCLLRMESEPNLIFASESSLLVEW